MVFGPSMAGGGAERAALQVATLLGRRVDVELVVATAVGPLRDEVPADVRLVDLERDHVRGAVVPLVRRLRTTRPDAVVSFQAHANAAVAVAHRVARSAARLVLSQRDQLSSALGAVPPVRRAALRAVLQSGYRRADAVIAVSTDVAADIEATLGVESDRIHVVHNPVDVDALRTTSRLPSGHPWLDRPGPPVVVAAGRLVPVKGFDTLLRAFATVRHRRPARMVVIGDGAERDALASLASSLGVAEDVDLPGHVANPASYIARGRTFVLASVREGFPNVLAEAVALGVPVVATDCGGAVREIVDDGDTGQLVPVGDAVTMAHAIDASLDAPRPTAPAGDRFSPDAIAQAYLDLLFPGGH